MGRALRLFSSPESPWPGIRLWHQRNWQRRNSAGSGRSGAQTLYILQKIDNALRNVGSSLNDVVRARYWVTDLAQADAIGRSHAKLLGKVRPAMTMAEVSGLMLPEHLVEIEVDAVITEPIKNEP